MALKAIETRYNGYRFRSRLEARWAVFFDAAGIVYEYEHEGFDLEDAGLYLPDFWLPDLLLWIEIKPTPEQAITTHETLKALNRATGCPCAVVNGLPGSDLAWAVWNEFGDDGGGVTSTDEWTGWGEPVEQGFLVCPHCSAFFAYYGFSRTYDKYDAFGVDSNDGWTQLRECSCWRELHTRLADSPGGRIKRQNHEEFNSSARRLGLDALYHTMDIASIAKSARFEHGEHPITGK